MPSLRAQQLNSNAYNQSVEHQPEKGGGEDASREHKAKTLCGKTCIRVLERFDGRRRHGNPLRSKC